MDLVLAAVLILQEPAPDFESASRRAVARDAFPVFSNPRMTPAAQVGDAMRAADRVIGVVVEGEAKAYPIVVMGVHELGNDACGGKPIAVSW